MTVHDVVIVGARLAGSTAAVALAKAGRDVVVLDRTRFPSDTLSTHVMFSSGVEELKRAGAWEKIAAQDPSYLRWLHVEWEGETIIDEPWGSCGETNYVACIPRPIQDTALVESAREHGADVREGCEFLDVLWRGGRVCGVRYRDGDGEEHELHAMLVIGADGRKSAVAARVGSWYPYRGSKNGRGLVFRYFDDPLVDTPANSTLWQWRDGNSVCMVFPSAPRPRTIALVMGPAADVSRARKDPDGTWESFLRRHPGFAKRIEGGTNFSKLRSTAETSAYFRAGTGPGWALAGDASHFKDPVIGQGQRDATWMGRTLGEAVAPVLDDPGALDLRLRRWEQERDDECIAAYHFANNETRIKPQSPVLIAAARATVDSHSGPDLGDVFNRVRSQQEVLSLPRLVRSAAAAIASEPLRAGGIVRESLPDLATDLRIRAEVRAHRFRSTRTITGSEHPGWTWPDPPRRPVRSTAPATSDTVASQPAAAEPAPSPTPTESPVPA